MDFSVVAGMFDRLESTSSRLEMADIMADYFSKAGPGELKSMVYLSQGRLGPEFATKEFGMADRLVLKAISFTSGDTDAATEALWFELGDPGAVAERLLGRKKQTTLFSEKLTLGRVIEVLTAIANAEGRDSQDKKMKLLANLLHNSDPVEARYICRIVAGRMRIGVASMTMLDALAIAFAEKSDRDEIERAFNVTSDLGLVAEALATGGLDAVREIKVGVGNPIKVMLAERLPSLGEILGRMGGRCALEYKYDGIRVQAHISPDGVKLYSRRLEDLTPNFPDIVESLRERCRHGTLIVEGECVAVDPETEAMLPFQNVTLRRRKHNMAEAVMKVPVRLFMFDLLYADGVDYTVKPFPERRAALADAFELGGDLGLTHLEVVSSEGEADAFFDGALAKKCEGIMAKSLNDDSVYRAGSRGFLWIKYKRDYRSDLADTFDLVVVGAFHGRGKRAGLYGALLMAVYDEDTGRYGTVCKLGTGFDDAFLEALPGMLEGWETDSAPKHVDAEMKPDVWVEPAVVLEVAGAEMSVSPIHTAAMGVFREGSGVGIRFPRFTGRVRDDKAPEDATTVAELVAMYRMQLDPAAE
ncbi:MAG: ATP-dependent DNA ligase [Thermoplasmatales archaeon]|nr:ATP-dependent DNA ligase [Thermoplasmatales archaeon]